MTPQTGTKKLDKRAMVVKEIVDTERKYVSELKVLVECFVRPSRLYLSELRTLSGVSGGAQDGVVGRLEALLGLSVDKVSEVMGEVARGVFEAVESEVGTPLQKRGDGVGDGQSWLVEVYVRLHVWLHRAGLLPIGGPDVWGHARS